jgi:hypothetical protein
MSFAQRVLANIVEAGASADAIHRVIDEVTKVSGVKWQPQYGVGRDAHAFIASMTPEEAKKVASKLQRALKFKAATPSRQDPPIAGTAGTKRLLSWDPKMSSHADGWATKLFIIPESARTVLYLSIATFSGLK